MACRSDSGMPVGDHFVWNFDPPPRFNRLRFSPTLASSGWSHSFIELRAGLELPFPIENVFAFVQGLLAVYWFWPWDRTAFDLN